ncbi:hypothetical protein BHE83_23530 (plasmid) [Xanthomonas euvesicatoria pv. vesicatoria str. 85-10]|uniref:Uncharacterized protein n=1 Tax=Xanthomonas euvesicatoria pv. vesicatoria (strain 85-10) TaxID=316273 RepID=Q3C0G4_XANE5|nr:hypothetical protein [Xanthomonas euvesicatoria]AOY69558.1 hypothetical protein BHE83_23530 [Xanthomonas euvesicatoria pv. vesicatoria str. 85-10]MCC8577861.1 hypothetical protein [Xanthomonas euvesicatoria pv. euvesicatoria]CAJ19769.1 conserved hypothetical protein [Xanthomonas euvesicatoria pv. vesicatoria str. 85-10]
MATKKTADLSGLVATKGAAAPVAGMPVRAPAPRSDDTEVANNEPLNFRVSGDFRRRFRMFAAAHDMKLNELLRLVFEEYEKKHG